MTKILIVDDEPAQSRGLSRAIRLRRPDFTVLTSGDGIEALSVLEAQQVDLVLTDLQMQTMSGFELIAWLSSNRPSVLTFAMTAHAGADTEDRLHALGAVEAFAKPLDVDALLHRVSEGLSSRIRGHVQNVGLASFVQLVELEQKTCTLDVESGASRGQLYVKRGHLVDARTGELTGDEAAVEILGWEHTNITIEHGCRAAEPRIAKPTHYLIMESMRVHDESLRSQHELTRAQLRESLRVREGAPSFSEVPLALVLEPSEPDTQVRPVTRLLPDAPHLPVGVLALALVDVASGGILMGAGRSDMALEEITQSARTLLEQKLSTLARAAPDEQLDELVVMTPLRAEVLRMLGPSRFVLLVFDPSATNLVMARFELQHFVSEYGGAGAR